MVLLAGAVHGRQQHSICAQHCCSQGLLTFWINPLELAATCTAAKAPAQCREQHQKEQVCEVGQAPYQASRGSKTHVWHQERVITYIATASVVEQGAYWSAQ